jgi:hypothetical protein
VAVSDWRDSSPGWTPREDEEGSGWTGEGERAADRKAPETGGGLIWPVALTLSLLVVVCVNLAFVYIAVTGADEVVPSYVEEER